MRFLITVAAVFAAAFARGADHEPQQVQAPAALVIHADAPFPNRIPKFLTGKFCEHLGANIYNGMDAQILRNATFADFPLWSGHMTPDGLTSFHFEKDKIEI